MANRKDGEIVFLGVSRGYITVLESHLRFHNVQILYTFGWCFGVVVLCGGMFSVDYTLLVI